MPEQLGVVGDCARHESPAAVTEARVLAGLREQAAAVGADAVIGLRIDKEQDLVIGTGSARRMEIDTRDSTAEWLKGWR